MEKTRFLVVLAPLILAIPRIAFGDELAELKAQLQQVQQENKALQEQLNRQGAITERLLGKLEGLERKDEALSQEVRSLQEKPAEPLLAEPAEPAGVTDLPKLNLKGFADVGFTTKLDQAESSNTFALGSVDLYMTSELTDRVSALVEANFVSTQDNAASLAFQRGLLKYSLSDLLNVTIAARMHMPLGYWNQAYHHGSWLQTTIFRPEIYLFEGDDGGFLPVHSVGVELSGVKEFNGVDAEYAFDVVNGRGRTVTEVQHAKDKNDAKALNFLLSLKPHAIEGLQFGASIYRDEIPGNPPTALRGDSIHELILGQYAAYHHDRVELLAELFNIFHDDKASGEEYDTLGWYLQGGYQVDKFTPYYRIDYIDVANSDPFFIAPRNIDRTKHTWGLRWDPLAWNALKFEYSFADLKQRDDEHSFTVNSSFAF